METRGKIIYIGSKKLDELITKLSNNIANNLFIMYNEIVLNSLPNIYMTI